MTSVLNWLKKQLGGQIRMLVWVGKRIDWVSFHSDRHYRYIRQEILLNAFDDQIRLHKLLATSSPPIIFDLGANIGQTTSQYRTLFPTAKIYSFEPFPEAYETLKTTFANDKNIIPVQQGISSKVGEAELYVSEASVMNSLLPPSDLNQSSFGSHATTVTVPLTTIDEFCMANDIDFIDILKIDVQGQEIPVFEGARKMLEEQRIGMIYVEIQHRRLYNGQSKYYEVFAQLDQANYSLFNLYNTIYNKRSGRFSWCDAIFVNQQLDRLTE